MADQKITGLTNFDSSNTPYWPPAPASDVIPIVDISDNTMAASGTTKKISINNLLSSSPTASGALTVTGLVTAGSATITGAATVGTTLGVTGVSTFAAGTALLPALTTTGDTNTGIYYPAADTFAVTTGGTERYRIDSAGNCGIGVTPSAWNATYNVLDIGQNGSISGRTSTNNTVDIVSNGFRDSGGTWVYKLAASSAASRYQIDGGSGSHLWYSGVAGTAGNTIAGFSTPIMTLDSNGNLILLSSNTPATLATNGQLTVNATSNTNLRFSYRGSDGTTRVANITLA